MVSSLSWTSGPTFCQVYLHSWKGRLAAWSHKWWHSDGHWGNSVREMSGQEESETVVEQEDMGYKTWKSVHRKVSPQRHTGTRKSSAAGGGSVEGISCFEMQWFLAPLGNGAAGEGQGWLTRERELLQSGGTADLHQGRLRLDIREHFFAKRVVKHWNSLPGEVVDVPSLSAFKRHLENTFKTYFTFWSRLKWSASWMWCSLYVPY